MSDLSLYLGTAVCLLVGAWAFAAGYSVGKGHGWYEGFEAGRKAGEDDGQRAQSA